MIYEALVLTFLGRARMLDDVRHVDAFSKHSRADAFSSILLLPNLAKVSVAKPILCYDLNECALAPQNSENI